MGASIDQLEKLFNEAKVSVTSFEDDLLLDNLMNKIDEDFLHNKEATKEEVSWCLSRLRELESCIIQEQSKTQNEVHDLRQQMIRHQKYLNTMSLLEDDLDDE